MGTPVKKLALDAICIIFLIYEFCFFWIFLAQAIIPGMYTVGFKTMMKRHIERTGDVLMNEKPNWFRFSLWIELILGNPLLGLFIWGFAKKIFWIKICCGLFAASLASVTFLIEGEYWLNDELTSIQKLSLSFLYLPRLLVSIFIVIYIFTLIRLKKLRSIGFKKNVDALERVKSLNRMPSRGQALEKLRNPSAISMKRQSSIKRLEISPSIASSNIKAFEKEEIKATAKVTTINVLPINAEIPSKPSNRLPPIAQASSPRNSVPDNALLHPEEQLINVQNSQSE